MLYILLLPLSVDPENFYEVNKYIHEKRRGKEDELIILKNNIDKFQLLDGEKYSPSQFRRKLDQLTSMYNKIIKDISAEKIKLRQMSLF